MNVVVIAPHPDDEAIGCGGSIRLHADGGDRVVAVFLTSGELGLKDRPREEAWRVREGEAAAAAEVLGIRSAAFLRFPDWFVEDHVAEAAAALGPVLRREAPGLIYVPHAREWHPDHRAALHVVGRALGGIEGERPALRAYEVWTPMPEFDHVRDVTASMAAKLRAVRCYRSQLAGFRYDFAVRGLNRYRGALAARCRFAEVFQEVLGELPGGATGNEAQVST